MYFSISKFFLLQSLSILKIIQIYSIQCFFLIDSPFFIIYEIDEQNKTCLKTEAFQNMFHHIWYDSLPISIKSQHQLWRYKCRDVLGTLQSFFLFGILTIKLKMFSQEQNNRQNQTNTHYEDIKDQINSIEVEIKEISKKFMERSQELESIDKEEKTFLSATYPELYINDLVKSNKRRQQLLEDNKMDMLSILNYLQYKRIKQSEFEKIIDQKSSFNQKIQNQKIILLEQEVESAYYFSEQRDREVIELEKKVKPLESDNKFLKIMNETLELDNNDLKQMLTMKQQELQKGVRNNRFQISQLSMIKEEFGRLCKSHDKIQNQLNLKQKQSDQNKFLEYRLKEEIERCKVEFQNELKNKCETIRSLEQNLSKQQSKYEFFYSYNQTLESKLKDKILEIKRKDEINDQLREQIEELSCSCQKFDEKVEYLIKDLSQKEEYIIEINSEANQKRSDITELEKKVKKLEQVVSVLKEQIKAKNTDNHFLSEIVNNYAEKQSCLEDQIYYLRIQLENNKKQNCQFQSKNKQLVQSDIEKNEKLIDSIRQNQKMAIVISEIKGDFEDEIASLIEENEDLKKESSSKSDKIVEVQIKNYEFEQSLFEIQEIKEKQVSKIAQLEKVHQILNKTMQHDALISLLKQKQVDERFESYDLQTQVKKLKINELTSQIMEKEIMLNEISEENKRYVQDINKRKEREMNKDNDINGLKIKISALEKKVSKNQREVQKERGYVVEYEEKIDELEEIIERKQKENQIFYNEITSEYEKIDQAKQKQVAQLQCKIISKTEENGSLLKEIKILIEKSENLFEQNNQLKHRIESLEQYIRNENLMIIIKSKTMQEKILSLEQYLMKESDENALLKDQLSNMIQQNNVKNNEIIMLKDDLSTLLIHQEKLHKNKEEQIIQKDITINRLNKEVIVLALKDNANKQKIEKLNQILSKDCNKIEEIRQTTFKWFNELSKNFSSKAENTEKFEVLEDEELFETLDTEFGFQKNQIEDQIDLFKDEMVKLMEQKK